MIISTILFLNFAFIRGSQKQMRETLRMYTGDITLSSRDKDYDLVAVKKSLENASCRDSIEMIVSGYLIGGAKVVSDNGYLANVQVRGYSSNYLKWMGKSVSWIDGGLSLDEPNKVIIERSVALNLEASAGDRIIVEYRTPEGAINTAIYEVAGIFIGNKYVLVMLYMLAWKMHKILA